MRLRRLCRRPLIGLPGAPAPFGVIGKRRQCWRRFGFVVAAVPPVFDDFYSGDFDCWLGWVAADPIILRNFVFAFFLGVPGFDSIDL